MGGGVVVGFDKDANKCMTSIGISYLIIFFCTLMSHARVHTVHHTEYDMILLTKFFQMTLCTLWSAYSVLNFCYQPQQSIRT